MKKGRFLWSAYRITEKQKAGKARNIKEKQLKNSRNMASKLPAAHLSSPNVNLSDKTLGISPVPGVSFAALEKSGRLLPCKSGSSHIDQREIFGYNR